MVGFTCAGEGSWQDKVEVHILALHINLQQAEKGIHGESGLILNGPHVSMLLAIKIRLETKCALPSLKRLGWASLRSSYTVHWMASDQKIFWIQ